MSITDLIPIPANINSGVNSARQITMKALLGNPRGNYTNDCQSVTNPDLKKMIKTAQVGTFRVTGLSLAIDSLQSIFADIKNQEPKIYDALGTAGMLCVRLGRNSATSISNHSWGTAIDLNLNGRLDAPGNRKVQRGLAEIAPIFNRHKWYWGAGFPKEDGMHFEASDQKIRQWHADGEFNRMNGTVGNPHNRLPDAALSIGDRGRQVKLLQEKLNENGAKLGIDGIFGLGTQAAVMNFQALHNLAVDGIAGKRTLTALGI